MLKLIREAMDDILWPAVFVMFFWISFVTNLTYDLDWNSYGIRPRTFTGLRGVLFSPFLHGDFGHIFSNSIPFLVSGGFVFHFWKQKSWQILGLLWFFSGFPVWLYGNSYSIHIGASGVVYGLVAFVLSSGIIRKNRNLSAIALLLIFLYGGMVWGLFPQVTYTGMNISWEGHLSGALSGIGLAFFFRKEGPPDDPEPEDDEEAPDWWLESDETLKREDLTIRYHYRPDSDRDANPDT